MLSAEARNSEKESLRILLLSNAMGRGGAEIQVKDYALRLVERGHAVLVISMLPFEEFDDELLAGGVEIASLDMTKGKASASALFELVRHIRLFRPDVIHAHMFAAILAARAARAVLEPWRLVGHAPPVVLGTAHTPFEAKDSRYLAYRVTEPFSDLWTCVCREGVERHERRGAVPRGKGLLTVNGIDTEKFRPNSQSRGAKRRELGLADDTFAWLTAGSFRNEQKDYGNLLRAFARVAEDRTKVRLVIAGEGVLLEEKKRLATELGIADRVDFLGLRADLHALLQAADGFVLGSAWEAMPLVLLEAGASGVPAVATDVGENADLLVDQSFIVPPKDDGALANAMTKLMHLSPGERRHLGDRAREHIARTYDIEVVVSEWERRYVDVLSRVELRRGGATQSAAS